MSSGPIWEEQMRTLDTVFAAFTVLLGIGIVWSGFGYGYFVRGVPGPGFFPVIVGFLIVGLGSINVARSMMGIENLEDAFDRSGILKTAACALIVGAYILLVPVLGMIVGAGIMMFALGLVITERIDPRFLVYLAASSIAVPFVSWLLFGVYLGVRLQTGLLGI